ncbi:MAG TPA: SRPBCC domain-containing protein [Chitinophagaceae bacterium]|nr:SRPBCC domain-containing protein [Chitinophagaceae bacterium]
MENKKLQIKAGLKILKPVHQVFEAIVDPAHMAHYFIAKSSGRMEPGATLTWQFPEFDMQFPVRVYRVEENKLVSYYWDDMDGTETLVEINLEPKEENETMVKITEGTKDSTEEGIAWYGRNTEGWANFLACLKAYLEYGINLRKGAFDLSQMPENVK